MVRSRLVLGLAMSLLVVPGCRSTSAAGSDAEIQGEFHVEGRPIPALAILMLASDVVDPLPAVVAVSIDAITLGNLGRTGEEYSREDGVAGLRHPELLGNGFFEYRRLGMSSTGVHVLEVFACTGGSGVFKSLLFVRLERDRLRDEHAPKVRTILRSMGSVTLGDRDDGEIKMVGDQVILGRSRYRPLDVVLSADR